MRFKSKKLFMAAILLCLLGGAGITVLSIFTYAYSPVRPGATSEAFVMVQKNEGPREVTRALSEQKVIGDPDKFILVGRITRQWKKIKAGEYRVTPAMTPMEIFTIITSGISVPHPVTVREGENMYEIAADIEAKGLGTKAAFLKLCKDPKFLAAHGLKGAGVHTAEGYLFPDTYFFNRTMSTEDMIHQMIRKFLAVWTPELEKKTAELGMTRNQLLTLASMIEKETGAQQERPMISSVFHNRLKKKMRLQSDPTTIYGIWERYDGNIRKADLLTENPYNTYTVPALPLGPISNPGIESIKAALNPVSSEFLFFVSHNDGTHEFTRSFEEHNLAVRKFQIDPKAREGKSWRDLSKKPHS